MKRKAIEMPLVEIEAAAASPSRLYPRGGIQSEKNLRKQRPFSDSVEQFGVLSEIE